MQASPNPLLLSAAVSSNPISSDQSLVLLNNKNSCNSPQQHQPSVSTPVVHCAKNSPAVPTVAVSPSALSRRASTSPTPVSPVQTSPNSTFRNSPSCGVKRPSPIKVEDETASKRLQMSDYCDASPESPSRVLFLRNLFRGVTEVDIDQLVAPFSRNWRPKIYLQASAGHAFVEFADEQTATDALQYFRLHAIQLKGSAVQATFSKRECVTTMEEKSDPFRVVLASVTNLMYPVDIELMNFLFSKYGVVEKIVTFTKSPSMYQALIQFQDADQAKAAMISLNNRNIYDGCNTLQIQPSRLPELVVKINSSKSWDFTVAQQPPTAQQQGGAWAQQSILPTPSIVPGAMQQKRVGGGVSFQYDQGAPGKLLSDQNAMSGMIPVQQMQGMPMQHSMPTGGGGVPMPRSTMQSRSHAIMDRLPRELREMNLDTTNPNQTPVIIVYNLSAPDINVPKLFNLFSLYGTVHRIKILREKPDTALIQFSDPLYATIAYNFLQGAPVFKLEQGIQIGFSKNTEVKLPPPGSNDTDDDLKRTRSFQMKDQRYGQEDDMEKYVRGACRPTAILFIANIHEDVIEDEMQTLFARYGEVKSFQFRPPKEGSRKRMAFVEMGTELEAILALCNLHNYRLRDSNIKVAFSKTNISSFAARTSLTSQ